MRGWPGREDGGRAHDERTVAGPMTPVVLVMADGPHGAGRDLVVVKPPPPPVHAGRVVHLRGHVFKAQVVVGDLRRAGDLGRAREAEDQQVDDEAVVLKDERSELEATDEAVPFGGRGCW